MSKKNKNYYNNNNSKKSAYKEKTVSNKQESFEKTKQIVEKEKTASLDSKKLKSRVSRHAELYTDNLSTTTQQQFDFGDLDLTSTLDTSFMEGKDKKKSKSKGTTKVLEDSPKVQVIRPKFFLVVLCVILFIICLILGGLYCYSCLHPTIKTKVVEKEKIIIDKNYLFLGDSITEQYDLDEHYKDLPVVNSGVSGNTTESILENMKKRVYDYNPSDIFLLIGINDLNAKKFDTNEIFSNITRIVEEIEKNRPHATIYIESIYPINRSDDKKIDLDMVGRRKNEYVKEINEELKKYCKENKLVYIDLYDDLADEEGNLKLDYTREGLHLNEEGYKVVTDKLMTYIENPKEEN